VGEGKWGRVWVMGKEEMLHILMMGLVYSKEGGKGIAWAWTEKRGNGKTDVN